MLTMPVETKPFDEADYLTSEKLIEGYLDRAIATGDSDVIRLALHVVARARNRLRRRSKQDDDHRYLSRCRGAIFVQHWERKWTDGCCHPSFICGQI